MSRTQLSQFHSGLFDQDVPVLPAQFLVEGQDGSGYTIRNAQKQLPVRFVSYFQYAQSGRGA